MALAHWMGFIDAIPNLNERMMSSSIHTSHRIDRSDDQNIELVDRRPQFRQDWRATEIVISRRNSPFEKSHFALGDTVPIPRTEPVFCARHQLPKGEGTSKRQGIIHESNWIKIRDLSSQYSYCSLLCGKLSGKCQLKVRTHLFSTNSITDYTDRAFAIKDIKLLQIISYYRVIGITFVVGVGTPGSLKFILLILLQFHFIY